MKKVLIEFDEWRLEADIEDLEKAKSNIEDFQSSVADILDETLLKKLGACINAINGIAPYLERLINTDEYEEKE